MFCTNYTRITATTIIIIIITIIISSSMGSHLHLEFIDFVPHACGRRRRAGKGGGALHQGEPRYC
jgi:hypothetical protein